MGTVEGDIQDSTAFTAGPDETIERALGFFSGLRGGIQALGIAHFGPVDIARDSPRFGHVLTTPKRGWADRDVVSEYRRGLAVPIAFQSDVNASAIGEGALGAAQGLRTTSTSPWAPASAPEWRSTAAAARRPAH